MVGFLQRNVVDQLSHHPFRKLLTNYLNDISKAIILLTDANSDKKAQIEWFWDTQIKQSLKDETLDVAKHIINIKVKDPIIQETLIAILDSYEEKYDIS